MRLALAHANRSKKKCAGGSPNPNIHEETQMLKDNGVDLMLSLCIGRAMRLRIELHQKGTRTYAPIGYVSTLALERQVNRFIKRYYESPVYVGKNSTWNKEDPKERAVFMRSLLKGMGLLRLCPIPDGVDAKKLGHVVDEKGRNCTIDYPNYDIIALPIFSAGNPGHWSLLVVYAGAGAMARGEKNPLRPSFFISHFDSITPHNRENVYITIDMLALVGVIPPGQTKFTEIFAHPVQHGNWECGYAIIYCMSRIVKRYIDESVPGKYTSPLFLDEPPVVEDGLWEKQRDRIIGELTDEATDHELRLHLCMTSVKEHMYFGIPFPTLPDIDAQTSMEQDAQGDRSCSEEEKRVGFY